MVELRREDWEDAKAQAEQILRQVEISRIVNENLYNIAARELKKFPAPEKKQQLPTGVN